MKQEFDFLDDFLKEKVESAHFPMKEEYWNKMSALLDEEDKKKKRGFPFWRGLSILFLLLSTAIGAYVVPRFVTKKSKAETEKKYEQPEPTRVETAHPSTDYTKTPNHETKDTPPSVSASSSVSNNISEKPITSNHPQEKHRSYANHTTQTNPNQTTTANAKEVKDPNSISSSQTDPNLGNIKKSSHAKSLSIALHPKKADPSVVASPTQKTINQVAASNDGLTASISSTPNNLPTHVTRGVTYQVTDTEVKEYRRVLTPEESNPRYRSDLLQYQPEYIELVTIITSKPLADNTANRTSSSSEKAEPKMLMSEEQKVAWSKKMILFGLAGININKGLRGDAENNLKLGLSPFVGFGLEKPLSGELSISAGLGYTYFNGLNQVKRENFYTYSFGVDSTLQSYYTKKLYQLYLPIMLTYHLGHGHHFTAGIGATYSFGTSGVVQEDLYKAMVSPSGLPTPNKSSTTVTPVTMSNTGFQTFDFFLQAGYSYQVTKRIFAQIMMQQGFLDISKNNYYNNSVNNTLTRVSVGVRYNLPSFSKK